MNDYFELQGKTVLITGASRGLGARFAEILAEQGCHVIAISRNINQLSLLKKKIETQHGSISIITADIAKPEDINNIMHDIDQWGAKIDVLINNAGIAVLTPLTEAHTELWQQHLNTNLLGPWLLTQAISQHMIAHKIRGSIINIASINGDKSPYSGASAYNASKAGLIQMTRSLVGELSPHGIRINAILPGLFYTDMTKAKIDEKRADLEARIPLGFIAEPADFDATILFLSSDKASRYVTGSCLTIDGGVSVNSNLV